MRIDLSQIPDGTSIEIKKAAKAEVAAGPAEVPDFTKKNIQAKKIEWLKMLGLLIKAGKLSLLGFMIFSIWQFHQSVTTSLPFRLLRGEASIISIFEDFFFGDDDKADISKSDKEPEKINIIGNGSLPPVPQLGKHPKTKKENSKGLPVVTIQGDEDKDIPLPQATKKITAGKLGDVSSFVIRGVWLATVSNIDWPKQPNLSESQNKKDLIAILDQMQRLNLNTLYFQVRPQGDAFYKSNHESWSRYISSDRSDPGWDPLEFAIEEGEKRGIAVFAWINPYRAGFRGQDLDPKHIGNQYPQYLYTYGKSLWLDPGSKEIQDHIMKVVGDLTKYRIAGIHVDDYFYPYPEAGREFPDDKTYEASGSTLSKADWRRQNVNTLMERISNAVRKKNMKLSVSPFGIYKNGDPVPGLSQYDSLFSDPITWMNQGWVDEVIPQLYWGIGSQQDYRKLLKWWNENGTDTKIISGNALHRVGLGEWNVKEIQDQIKYNKKETQHGFVLFSAKHLWTLE